MPKTGLNAHCPCGSRKKYKKCCMPPEERGTRAAAKSVEYVVERPVTAASSSLGLTAYVVARIFAESEEFAQMKKKDPARAANFWTMERVSSLTTPDIVARLGGLGVDGSSDAFRPLAESRTSAWDVGELWQQGIRKELSRFDQDFLGLTACELWKRYCPDRPSIEMLDDWMQEGYALSASGDEARACDRWQEVWEVIRSRLQPRMRTCDDASAVFIGSQCISNWVDDFTVELLNAALKDPAYARIGVQLCRELLGQFPGESDLFVGNLRADMGEFYDRADQKVEAERVFLDLIRDRPESAQGYVRLADMLSFGRGPQRKPLDLPRAIRILEDALARPVVDAAMYDVEARLEDMREELAQAADSQHEVGPAAGSGR